MQAKESRKGQPHGRGEGEGREKGEWWEQRELTAAFVPKMFVDSDCHEVLLKKVKATHDTLPNWAPK